MSKERDVVLLSELAHIIDSRHKTPQYSLTGMPMVRVVDVTGGRLDLSNTNRVSKEVYDDFSKGRDPQIGDLVISRVGSYGNICYVDSDIKFCLGQNTALIVPKGINWRFLYYQLISPLIKNQIELLVVGAVQKTISLKSIKSLEIVKPPLPEQKAIAHILGTLDDKIELNRRQNETLEAMAQALFKSWFVDFDPVLDNALAAGNTIPPALQKKAAQRQAVADEKKLLTKNPALAQLFPASFEFNEELGKWVPEGWGNGKLGDRYFVKGGFAFKSKDFVEKNGTPVVKIKSIKGDNSIDKSDLSMVSTSVAKQREDFWLNTGDILMAMTGATVGKFGVVVKDEEELIVLNQRVAKFYSKTLELRTIWFVYCFFNDSRNTDFIVNTAQGSAQPNISANEIMSAPMILSDLNLVQKFEEMVLPSFQKIIESQKQTETLTQLRDTLLPQLISGKLRVPGNIIIK
tara:strand:- start:26016 stop:27398 length:1383 start_codon:yes stop_codon:yes gene_type:complete